MKLKRRPRLIGALLALVSILFMQIVLAGYVCPKPAVQTSQTSDSAISATTSLSTTMPGCDGMDMAQPALCHASAHVQHQSLDKHDVPSVQPFAPAAISFVLVHAVLPTATNSIHLDTPLLSGGSPPPLAIQNCCFRI